MEERPILKSTQKMVVFIMTITFLSLVYQATATAAQPQVVAGDSHTMGLKSDGTVVAVGWNDNGQCDVSSWTGIQQVAAGRKLSAKRGPYNLSLQFSRR